MKPSYKHAALAVTLALSVPLTALGQAFPAKDVRFLNPFPPGGTADLVGRILAEQLAKQLGKQVLVETRTGANGVVAATEVIRSANDGHTILLVSMGMMTVSQQIGKLPYDVERDLTPIGNAVSVYNVLVVKGDAPYKTWQSVADAAKTAPDKLTCATVGPGSSQQLACALFMSLTGTKITQVPYRGGAPAITDMVGGRVDMMFGNMPEFLGQIKSGGLRAVAFGASEASPLLGDVPVIANTGLKDFVIHNWFGVVGPGGMAPDIQRRWNEELNRALNSAELKKQFVDRGLQGLPGSLDQFNAQMKSDRAKWGKIIKDFDIRAE
jgi:tripartite-type tricarboxylate transporter receptor subunit TctC